MSIQSQVTKKYEELNNPTYDTIKRFFGDVNESTLKSAYRRCKKNATNNASDAYSDRITMDKLERLIIQGKTPIPLLRVMTDFLKVKSQDHSELEEIDMELFYKKAMEE